MNGDTLDKIDDVIKKLQNNEVSTEVEEVRENTDTKIFDGNSEFEKTMEFNGVVEERPKEMVITPGAKNKNNDTLIIVLYVIALVITVLLVTGFILFLY